MKIPKDNRTFSAPERRRRKILDAALELVGEGGADAITHRSVAKRAKVSLGSTTYHYGTRDELIRAAFRHYLAEVSALFEAVGLRTPRSSVGDVVDLAVDIARRSIAEPVAVRAEYELILCCARDPILAREFVAYERAVESGLARLLERLDVRRPHDAARTIIDVVRGFEMERFARPEADTEDLRRRVCSFLEAITAQGRATMAGTQTKPALPKRRPKKKR